MISGIGFSESVFEVMQTTPEGRVVSYSQVAVMCGKPGAARRVGQVAHFGPSRLPWHRLVKADGSMASGYVPGGPVNQKKQLLEEGVKFNKDKVIMKDFQL